MSALGLGLCQECGGALPGHFRAYLPGQVITVSPCTCVADAELRRRVFEQARQRALNELTKRSADVMQAPAKIEVMQPPAPTMTPEQFAFWVKGLADHRSQTTGAGDSALLAAILFEVRRIRPK